MEELGKSSEQNNFDSGAEILSEMPSFAEHMEAMEKGSPIGEEYRQKAEACRDEYIEALKGKIEKIRNLQLGNVNRLKFDITDGVEFVPLEDTDKDKEDLASFKANLINSTEESIRWAEQLNIDELANCFKTEEMIDKIAEKMKSGERFSEEENEFLGNANPFEDIVFDTRKYELPWSYMSPLYGVPTYEELFNNEEENPQWGIVARAQLRKMIEEDRNVLHSNEEIQNVLGGMIENRNNNPFAGETNIDSATGEARTFTLEDNYPRLNGESEEDYNKRLRQIQLKTRLVEKRQK